MKRDLNLVRSLLLHFESKPNDVIDSCPVVPEHTELEVKYHLLLMYEAGLLRAEPEHSQTGRIIKVHPFSLTWHGHEFLEAARNDSLWTKATSTLASTAGAMPFAVLQALLISLAKDKLGI
jgi:hypothetical protein